MDVNHRNATNSKISWKLLDHMSSFSFYILVPMDYVTYIYATPESYVMYYISILQVCRGLFRHEPQVWREERY
jgi:hypothetical protein